MKYFLLYILLIVSNVFFAQDPYFINYTINDGLPSDNIYSVFQDEKGFIWFTTDVGVVKYSSKKITLFNTETGLTDNEVFRIKNDTQGRKWLLTLNGIPSFIKNDTIYNNRNSSLIKNSINRRNSILIDFYESKNQTIYLGSHKGEIVTIDKNETVSKIDLGKTSLYGVWEFNNNIYALTSKGIYDVLEKTLVKKSDYFFSSRMYHQNGKTFFSKQNVLHRIINTSYKSILTLPETSSEIININIENEQTTWICTRNGIYLYKNNQLVNHFFKNDVISSIIKDIENNYWVSTLNNGVYFIPSFNVFNKPIKINCINTFNNQIKLGGTQNDYYILNNNKLHKYTFNPEWRKDDIVNIRTFNQNTYIVGKVGTEKLNLKKEAYLFNANDILEAKNNIYIASNFTSKISHKRFIPNTTLPLHNKIILRKRSNVLASDHRNHLYIGTNFGLYKYTKKDSIQYLGKKNKSLETSIEDLLFDNITNNLLVATNSKGISVIRNDSLIYSFTSKDGINSNSCNSIIKIKNNNYLIGTNNGLNQIEINNNSFSIKNYNNALGFKNEKIKDLAILNDTIYIATNNKLIYLGYTDLTEQKKKPVCLIENILVDNNILTLPDQPTIPYATNDVSIEYTGVSFIDQGDVTYYFKLDETDKNWTSTKESRINYKSLAPNNYTFSVYCVNGFGEKSDIQTTSFTILKPFWMQWWFIGLCILLGVFILITIWQLRIRYLNLQFEKERKAMMLEKENVLLENLALELEQKALRLQMNPHFIFNALNSIKGYYAIGKSNEADIYISKFSTLLRLLLENEEQTTSLTQEIEMLRLYLDLTQTRYKDKFDYNIELSKNIDPNNTAIPFLILQPLVENAIIHGLAPKTGKGLLEISFSVEKSKLICIVEDNGIGRSSSQKKRLASPHQSKALNITKDRLHIFDNNASLAFIDKSTNGIPSGTQVKIIIELKTIW